MLQIDIEQLQSAWRWAARHHGKQRYALAEVDTFLPYTSHLGGVAFEVFTALIAEPVKEAEEANLSLQCAVLHDVIEDTPATYEQVRDAFGQPVAAGVSALSKDESLATKAAQMADSLARIRRQPAAVWKVKLADRIVNLSPPPFHWDRIKKATYYQEARRIHDALHEASPYLGERLRQKMDNYRQYLI